MRCAVPTSLYIGHSWCSVRSRVWWNLGQIQKCGVYRGRGLFLWPAPQGRRGSGDPVLRTQTKPYHMVGFYIWGDIMEEVRWKSDKEKYEIQKRILKATIKREKELYNKKKRTPRKG